MSDNDSHNEIKLTLDFLNWFKNSTGYIELFEDSDTSGRDPIDSAGYIGNELILIEFKDKICSGMINYVSSKGSSIEKKIGQVLKQIYGKENSKIYNSIKTFYNENNVPNIYIVANSISKKALKLLTELVEKRQFEWYFNAKIILWENDIGITIYENTNVKIKNISDVNIKIIDFINTAPKRKAKLNEEQIIARLKSLNKFDEYQLFINSCHERNLSINMNIKSINIKKTKTLFAIWPFDSDSINGLRISFNIEQINKELNSNIIDFSQLQVERNYSKIGYLGYNSYIKNIDEMTKLIFKLYKYGYAQS